MYFPRKIAPKIREFIEREEENKNVLLLAGARQVGKSTLIKEELRKYENVVSINLAEKRSLVDRIDSLKDFAEFEEFLLDEFNYSPLNGNILYIDEAQLSERLGSFVRFMKEKWERATVILSGSMLADLFKDRFPVGRVETIVLRPFTFEEFLFAQGKESLCSFLLSYRLGDEISDSRHQSLLKCLEQYFFVGGLPEVVDAYVSKGDWRRIREGLLEGYRHDFRVNFGASYDQLAWKCMQAVCYHVGSSSKYTHVLPSNEIAYKKIPEVIFRLESWHLILNSEQKGEQPELQLYPKRYPFDIGLAQEIRFTSRPMTLLEEHAFPEVRKAIGGMIEAFVATELLYLLPSLSGFKSKNYEIDFVIPKGAERLPVEVKASLKFKKQHCSSLLKYIETYSNKESLLFNMSKPERINIKKGGEITSLPLYLIGQIDRLGFC